MPQPYRQIVRRSNLRSILFQVSASRSVMATIVRVGLAWLDVGNTRRRDEQVGYAVDPAVGVDQLRSRVAPIRAVPSDAAIGAIRNACSSTRLRSSQTPGA